MVETVEDQYDEEDVKEPLELYNAILGRASLVIEFLFLSKLK